jgi:hypothetical protein
MTRDGRNISNLSRVLTTQENQSNPPPSNEISASIFSHLEILTSPPAFQPPCLQICKRVGHFGHMCPSFVPPVQQPSLTPVVGLLSRTRGGKARQGKAGRERGVGRLLIILIGLSCPPYSFGETCLIHRYREGRERRGRGGGKGDRTVELLQNLFLHERIHTRKHAHLLTHVVAPRYA